MNLNSAIRYKVSFTWYIRSTIAHIRLNI